ncbi:DUF3040 domain-containing protein [Nocardioides sp. CPCC 205120]|uniref:DUF3040 domain-containing protein n=1 Tax=Nocardioides sp. CPCC 205120 TaxID=3406462 RepID=UPI003B50F515
MPLSEEELRMLEQMERALLAEDPKFASTLQGSRMRTTARKRAIVAGVLFLGGVALLMTGVVTRVEPVSIVGFLVMLGSAVFGLTAVRARAVPATAETAADPTAGLTLIDGGRRPRRQRGNQRHDGSFMERLEERWRRRREGGGY